MKSGPQRAPISAKRKALLAIAAKSASGGKQLTAVDVARARSHQVTGVEINDTVLIGPIGKISAVLRLA